jgi:hypothetical protein
LPTKGAACPAVELMRRDEWFVGQPLCVRELFEERNTGASSSRRGRGLSRCPRRGREPADDLTAASARLLPPLLPAHFRLYRPSRLLPRLIDPLPVCSVGTVGSSRGIGSTFEKARYWRRWQCSFSHVVTGAPVT